MYIAQQLTLLNICVRRSTYTSAVLTVGLKINAHNNDPCNLAVNIYRYDINSDRFYDSRKVYQFLQTIG